MIGAVPTNSKAAVLALEWLLDHPEQLAGAQAAARADDDRLLAQYVWEALRFNPFSPVVYRRAIRDVRADQPLPWGDAPIDQRTPMLLRVVNANVRIGTPEAATRLAAATTPPTGPAIAQRE